MNTNNRFRNFAFSGGGVLGIAYIGMLEYLYKINVMQNIERVVGASAGAITACITAFNLPFQETKMIADSLEYSKVASKTDPSASKSFGKYAKEELNKIFGNVDCVYRLITEYGWYSSKYFYDWIKVQIANQFDQSKKNEPYTFLDFKNQSIHKNGRKFKDLYVVGTDVSTKSSIIFCAEETPNMEVAEAVRISMSVPVLFESVKSVCGTENAPKTYIDGGFMYNYPVAFFDKGRPSPWTLGAMFNSSQPPLEVDNLVNFIVNLLSCTTSIQHQMNNESAANLRRSIQIDTGDVAPMDFDIKKDDPTYNFLYQQGYKAAEEYFKRLYSW